MAAPWTFQCWRVAGVLEPMRLTLTSMLNLPAMPVHRIETVILPERLAIDAFATSGNRSVICGIAGAIVSRPRDRATGEPVSRIASFCLACAQAAPFLPRGLGCPISVGTRGAPSPGSRSCRRRLAAFRLRRNPGRGARLGPGLHGSAARRNPGHPARCAGSATPALLREGLGALQAAEDMRPRGHPARSPSPHPRA